MAVKSPHVRAVAKALVRTTTKNDKRSWLVARQRWISMERKREGRGSTTSSFYPHFWLLRQFRIRLASGSRFNSLSKRRLASRVWEKGKGWLAYPIESFRALCHSWLISFSHHSLKITPTSRSLNTKISRCVCLSLGFYWLFPTLSSKSHKQISIYILLIKNDFHTFRIKLYKSCFSNYPCRIRFEHKLTIGSTRSN